MQTSTEKNISNATFPENGNIATISSAPTTPAVLSNQTYSCPLDSKLKHDLNSDCGDQKTCDCLVTTIQTEKNPRLCTSYLDPDSPFRNVVVNCIRRDCGQFQFLLVLVLLGGGGLLGATFLFCSNGCTFRPEEDDAVSEETALEEQAQKCAEGAAGGDDGAEQFPADVDCTDGIDDGEVGVLAQWVLTSLYRSALEGPVEEARAARARVAAGAAAASLVKRLGLRLLLVVPLALQQNWVPVAFFAIDVAVLVYCAAAGAYCPGSLYNEVHVLVTGRRFVRRCPRRPAARGADARASTAPAAGVGLPRLGPR